MIPHTPAQALLWKCWRRTRRQLLLQQLITLAIVNLIFYFSLYAGDSEAADLNEGARTFIFGSLLFLWAACPDITYSLRKGWQGIGFAFYNDYTRPVSTAALLFIPLTYQCVLFLVAYLSPTYISHLLYGLDAPGFLSVFLIVETVVLFSTLQWWTTSSFGSLLGFIALLVLGYYNFLLPDSTIATLTGEIVAPLLGGYIAPLMAIVASIALLYFGVVKQRSGESLFGLSQEYDNQPFMRGFRISELIPFLRTDCPVSSPIRAALWKERQLRGIGGHIVYGIAMALLALISLASIAIFGAPREGIGIGIILGIFSGWYLVILIASPIGVFDLDYAQNASRVSIYHRTRPIGSAVLVAIKLGVVAVSLLAGFLAMWLTVFLLGPLFVENFTQIVSEAWQQLWVIWEFTILQTIGIVLIAGIGYVSILSIYIAFMTWATLHSSKGAWAMSGIAVYFFVLVIALNILNLGNSVEESRMTVRNVMESHLWIFNIGIPCAIIYLYRNLLQGHVLTLKQLAVLGTAGIALAIVNYSLTNFQPVKANQPLVIDAAMLIQAFIPLFAAALALWTMHRIRHT